MNADKYTVVFDYALMQPVVITELSVSGVVTGRSDAASGMEFRVLYCTGGARYETWFYSWELQSA